MDEIALIDVRESIFAANDEEAASVRALLAEHGVYMLNVLASPGAGKTALIVETIRRLPNVRIAVVEGDITSQIDAERIAAQGVPAVQVNTGGLCHLDATMVRAALQKLDLAALDLVVVENIGNLVCTADFDIGAHTGVVLLSVPEGDDKPAKYPLIFETSDACIVTKADYLAAGRFDVARVTRDVLALNPASAIIAVSSETGEGMEAWVRMVEHWLKVQR